MQDNGRDKMPRVRLHWDFFGPDAFTTAEHFLEHLDQFCGREGVTGYRHWVVRRSALCTAVMECEEDHLKLVRDALRPVRGERVIE